MNDHGVSGLCATRDLVVVCGAGGVGKTTVAAAMAVMAAVEQGGRVLVLTVDPARRLADALGLGLVGTAEHRVPLPPVKGRASRGALWAAMLDPRAGWDELVARHAPSAEIRDRLLANPLYRDVTGRFAHSHEYLAMERLHEVHTRGHYDLVVVDTPPSVHAIDVLDAPTRMIEFFESRLLRWLTVPSRSTLVGLASRPFYQVLDRVLGSRFGEDLSEMFGLLATLKPGFVERADQVRQLLADHRTAYVVVSTTEEVSMIEARHLVDELGRRSLAPAAIVLNRGVPDSVVAALDDAGASTLRQVATDPLALHGLACDLGAADAVLATVLTEMADRVDDAVVAAEREQQRLAEAAHLASLVVRVPTLGIDVTDIEALAQVGQALWCSRSRSAD
jgi:anion-transporting  ArsA/GET3 family ATPase